MSPAEQIIVGAVLVVAGAVLVFGTRRRWGWLVDPPEDLWFVYSGSFIKKFCGTDVLELLNIYLGIACIVGGVAGLGMSIWRAAVGVAP